MISGFTSAGLDVADLRVLPAAVARHLLKSEGYEAGFHVGTSQTDPEVVQIRFFEQPGISSLVGSAEGDREELHARGAAPRRRSATSARISYPARVRETYAQDLLAGVDVEAIRARGFRLVVDYGFSAASFVLPLVLGPLGVEAISAHGFTTDRSDPGSAMLREAIGQVKQLVPAVGADLGVVLDRCRRAPVPRRRDRPRDPRRAEPAALPAADRHRTGGAGSSRSRSPSRARSTSCSRAAGSRSCARPHRSPT